MKKKILILLAGILLIGSTLYAGDLNVSGNVGIGTTSPVSGKLQIQQDVNTAAIYLSGNQLGWGSGIKFNNTTPTSGRHYGIYSGSDGKFHISDVTGGVDRIVISSSGNVGIGTTTPANKLHVAGGGIDVELGTNEGASLGLINPLKTAAGQGRTWRIYNMTGVYGDSLQFWQYDSVGCPSGTCTPRMTLLDNGRVGIGTTTPVYKLDVRGGIVSGDGTIKSMLSFVSYPVIGSLSNHNLGIWAGGAEKATIATNGNVGIGTTTPGYKLDVQGGQINASGGLCISGSCKTDWSQVGGISQWTTSGSNIYYNSGNIGIGTTSPGAKLEVNTWASFAPPGINPILNLVGGYLGNNTQGHSIDFHINTLDYYPASRIVSTMSTGGGGELQFHTSSWYPTTPASAKMTITSSGNVGIGTTSPGYTLTVNGSSWTSSGAWSGSDIRWKKNIMPLNATLDKILKLNGVNYEWEKDGFKAINFSDGKQIGLIAQDVEKVFPELVRTDDDGYKAISYERLSVLLMKAVQEIAVALDITEAGSSSPAIKSAYKGNEAALAIDKDGNLGVGTNNPSSRLDVKGDIKTSGGISAASIASSGGITAHGNIVQSSPDLNNYGISLERTDEDTKYHAWTFWQMNDHDNNKNALEIWEYKANEKGEACTASGILCSPRLVIKEGGNVGIGTSDPQSKLEVNGGDIRITGGSIIDDGTTMNVPDYVFESGYKIKGINELSAFVEANKHLPGLPDASSKTEWSKISLQERDMKLLEKIEELTLYIIKQQREIEALRAEMRKVKE